MSVDSWDILIKIASSVICCPTGFKVDTMYWYSRFQHCFRASENLYNILNTHHCSFGYLFDTTSACSFQLSAPAPFSPASPSACLLGLAQLLLCL